MDFSKPHIYQRQIIATGKFYIGKHNGNNSKHYKGSGVDWLEDYKIYVNDPKVDIKEEILEYIEDISKLNEREEYWLKKFNVAYNPLFYNRTNRSRGWTFVNEEQREKLRKAHLGKKQSKEATQLKRDKMKGKSKHSEESKNAIGDKNRHPKPEGFGDKLRKPKSKSHCNNISKGKSTPVFQYDLEGNFIKEFESAKIASKLTGIRYGRILSNIKGDRVKNEKFMWKYKN